MNIKKCITALFGVLMLATVTPDLVQAQWSIGASYEIREEAPKNGFGARVEREILKGLPLVNLSLRAHFSYFSDENQITRDSFSYSQDITNYDYGLAAIGGISIGLLSPYIGVGLGSSTLDISRDNLPSGSPLDQNSDDSSIYWNGLVGAKVSVLPVLKPFVEYRLEDVSNYKDELNDIKDSNGRLVFGVSLSF